MNVHQSYWTLWPTLTKQFVLSSVCPELYFLSWIPKVSGILHLKNRFALQRIKSTLDLYTNERLYGLCCHYLDKTHHMLATSGSMHEVLGVVI